MLCAFVVSLNSLDDRRCGHAVTDAHGLQAILRLAPLQLVDQLGHQDGAGCAALPPA